VCISTFLDPRITKCDIFTFRSTFKSEKILALIELMNNDSELVPAPIIQIYILGYG
jgi:hypothetical protein